VSIRISEGLPHRHRLKVSELFEFQLIVELEEEKPVTHVLVREHASPVKRTNPAKTRKAAAVKQDKPEVTLDSSNYEFSKDYSEEERAYQELKGRTDTHRAAVAIKETHYEDEREEEEEEVEEEDEDEEAEDEGDDEVEQEEEQEKQVVDDEDDADYENQVLDDEGGFDVNEEPEDFVIAPRQSIFTPLKNAVLFISFFIYNLISSIFHAIRSFVTRLIEIFIYIPILWVIDSFKSLFRSLDYALNRVFAALGATGRNDLFKTLFATTVSIALLAAAVPPSIQLLNKYHVLDGLVDFRFKAIPGAYIPPDLPPSSAEEIVDRLLELEKLLSTYSSLSHQVLEEHKSLRRDNQDEKIRRAAMDDSIYLVKQEIEKLNGYVTSSSSQLSDLKLFNKDTKETIKDLHQTILRLDAEVEHHQSELKSLNSKPSTALSEIKTLKSNIDALKRGLTHVEGELKRISDYEHISKIALKSIAEYLPSQLAVRVNPKTKRVEINPEFWTALRGVFADREEMEKSVSAQAGKIADAKIVQREFSWNEFLRGNEEAIKGFVKVQMDDRWNKAGEEGIIVSRDYFLEILRNQVAELQGGMEGKMKTLVDKFEKSSKENLAKAMASADAVLKRVKKTSGKGDLSSEAMNSIVETALHRYSTDTLAKPDFALYSSGARINPLLTSPTYHHKPKPFYKKIGSYILGGAGSTWGHQPAMALFQDTNVGMCWAFPGSQGGLGIRLSESVLVTDVSVEHVHREVSKNIGSAPKDWSLYALISDDAARAQVESINSGLYDSLPPANLPRGYALLVKGVYDINNEEGRTIQTVPVPAAIRRLNIPIEQVVFAVASNWGNPEYTCLYRVRVHGQGLQQDEDGHKGFGDDEVV
jgi:hypothetical protein